MLFLLIDPLGNIPVIFAVLKNIPPKRQKQIIIREMLLALIILFLFLFAGKPLLNMLHLQEEAVTISGGLILLIIGIRMIFPQPEGIMGQTPGGEPLLVPIAIPMIAGPSIMAMLILLAQNGTLGTGSLIISLLLAWLAAAIILLYAPFLLKVLKERGLIALERLMGMILVMMAVQMLIDGFKTIFNVF
jgi:multiple antibiotic resistance protein